uniref:Defensin Lc-def n=2 Tax=Lens culinaris TaxID=3864 RepID=DEF_LENCC|nr:RecName: Full=Defensin Lc-def; Flags: Precursor [Lens culinaris subsp. culinaris]ABP04037.1 defensin precursor [Lens culinaris subsp. culinaris]ATG83507.1 defensin 2 [Lens culinaris]
MEKKTVAALSFLFIVLFVAQEIAVTEAKTCENLSDSFKGPCIPDGNCNKHCKEKEHLLSGRCRDDFRCWCTRNC